MTVIADRKLDFICHDCQYLFDKPAADMSIGIGSQKFQGRIDKPIACPECGSTNTGPRSDDILKAD